jgi:hypothetical protein
MGYASKGERVVGEFESTIGTPYCFGSVEVGSFVFNVVYLERIECKFENCEAINGGVEAPSSVECDMGGSVPAAGSGRKMRGRDDTEWVDELLGFAQLGLGRAIAGLLEGILDGPKSVTVRNRVRAVLNRLQGLKGVGFGPPSLSTPFGHVQGLRKGKCGVYGVGLGRLKRVRRKPLGSSSQ